ncbi:MAG: DUF4112 domain-containing protein [Acidobacteriota bacterium]|nr:DUF4112 domain-containing protein [Acidobacteriota bacterium]
MPPRVHVPEVLEPDEKLPQDLVALRKFAFLMDQAFPIPGTNVRVGFDAVLGLIPWVGDILGGILSTWIIAGALRHRVPGHVIMRMVWNVAIDLLFGAVPVAGDVFDFMYEENMMNMRLLEKHRDRTRPPRTGRQIAFTLSAIIALLMFIALVLIAAVVAVLIWLIGPRSWL